MAALGDVQAAPPWRSTSVRIARRLVRTLPDGVRRRLDSARSLVDRNPDTAADVTLPPDVADRAELVRFLGDAHVFSNDTEANDYLSDALERFRITMALLPPMAPGDRILELGANPYFLTRLLRRRGLDVTCANFFGDDYPGPIVQHVVSADGAVRESFEFDHFNVERERFPYPDDSFDVVLFCEIMEHLPCDPIHTLAEIHRVLVPGGTLVLTTPNAVRLTNLVKIWHGENPYEELSGYGAYGRHNREYTVDELTRILMGCGYSVEHAFAADLHPHGEQLPVGLGAAVHHRGDNLFVLARPHGEPRWYYPRWLYSSRHALRRVVRPDFVAGHNDALQGDGFWEAEAMGGTDICWMGAAPRAIVTLAPDRRGTGTLRVEGFAAPPIAGAPLTLRAATGSSEVEWTIPCDGERFVREAVLIVPEEGSMTVELTTDRMWSPAALGVNEDGRSLGVAIHRVALHPV